MKKKKKRKKRPELQQGNLVSLRWHFRERCPQILFFPRVFYVTTIFCTRSFKVQATGPARIHHSIVLVFQLTLILIPAFGSCSIFLSFYFLSTLLLVKLQATILRKKYL